jgi:hypothetical protein
MTPKLEQGVMYRLVYKQQAGNYQWYKHEMVALYIGENNDQYEPKWIFSLRPEAGTQDMKKENLLEAWEMPKNYPPKLPRRVGKYVESR